MTSENPQFRLGLRVPAKVFAKENLLNMACGIPTSRYPAAARQTAMSTPLMLPEFPPAGARERIRKVWDPLCLTPSQSTPQHPAVNPTGQPGQARMPAALRFPAVNAGARPTAAGGGEYGISRIADNAPR